MSCLIDVALHVKGLTLMELRFLHGLSIVGMVEAFQQPAITVISVQSPTELTGWSPWVQGCKEEA